MGRSKGAGYNLVCWFSLPVKTVYHILASLAPLRLFMISDLLPPSPRLPATKNGFLPRLSAWFCVMFCQASQQIAEWCEQSQQEAFSHNTDILAGSKACRQSQQKPNLSLGRKWKLWTSLYTVKDRRTKQRTYYDNLKHLFIWCKRINLYWHSLTSISCLFCSIPSLATCFCFSFHWFKRGSCQLLAKVCAPSTGQPLRRSKPAQEKCG